MRRSLATVLFVAAAIGFAGGASGAVSDLAIIKNGPASPAVAPSSFVLYSINITNNGPDLPGPVTVTDVLPPGTTLIEAQTNFPGVGCSGTTTITCTFPNLGVGFFAGVVIQVTAPSTPGPFTNTATVSSSATDLNPLNNTATLTLTVVPPGSTADLALTKTGPVGNVPTSSTIVYRLLLTNNGPDPEPAPVITDVLPPGATFVAVNPIVGTVSCTGTTTIVCTFGPMPSGDSADAALIVTAPAAPGSFTNTATASGSRFDPNPANNTSSSTATAVAQTFVTDLAITKTGPPPGTPIAPGSNVHYSVTITNNGPDTASSVTVVDILPPGTQLVTAQSNVIGASCTGTTTVVCTFPQFGVGGFMGVAIVVTAPQGRGGPFTNTATVTSAQSDPNAANNTASLTLSAVTPDIPALSPFALLLLAAAIATAGAIATARSA